MSLKLTRDDSDDNTDFMQMAGPGPAVNAAASANSITGGDPTLRDPNAALDYYTQRTSPEIIVGVVFIVILTLFGLTLWIALDKDVRKKLRAWGAAAAARCRGTKTPKVAAAAQTRPMERQISDSARSDVTQVGRDLESGLKTKPDAPTLKPTASQNSEKVVPAGTRSDMSVTVTVPALPSLALRRL